MCNRFLLTLAQPINLILNYSVEVPGLIIGELGYELVILLVYLKELLTLAQDYSDQKCLMSVCSLG